MKTNNLIIPFLTILFTLMAFVNCQSTGTTDTANTVTPTPTGSPNKIQQCLDQNNCGNDQACRAKCAGVPDPSESSVNATNDCVAKCNQSDPQEAYKACVNNCYQAYYFPSSTSPTETAAPSGVSTANTASTTGGPSGSASGSASGSSPSGSTTPKPVSAAASLRYQPENLYPLMVLVISVIAGMLGVFY